MDRRRFLRNAALAAGALAIPKSITRAAHAQVPVRSLVGGLDVGRLISAGQLWDWQNMMVDLGPRFCGSPPHNTFVEFLEEECQRAGLRTHHDPTQRFPYWEADYRACGVALAEGAGSYSALEAMSYFPGSGTTAFLPGGALEAPLVDVGEGLPHDFAAATGRLSGSIAFCTEKPLPMSEVLGYPHYYVDDPDRTMTPLTEWDTWALSILAPQSVVTPGLARDNGCVGMIIALEATTECARGQFISFLASEVVGDQANGETGMPILYVDYRTGQRIRERLSALGSTTRARMVLPATTTHDVGSDGFVAVLPATSDPDHAENVLITSHTDGTSASEENGPLAMISMARYFAQMPERRRNLVFAFSTGHMNAYTSDTEHFLEHNPDLVERTVASMTVEHLGQRKWLDDPAGDTYADTGLPEMGVSYVSQNPLLIQSVIANYKTEHMVRAPVVNGPGFGVSIPLFAERIPSYAYITGPSALYQMERSTVMAITDPDRMHQELRAFVRILQSWEGMSADDLRTGVSLTRM